MTFKTLHLACYRLCDGERIIESRGQEDERDHSTDPGSVRGNAISDNEELEKCGFPEKWLPGTGSNRRPSG